MRTMSIFHTCLAAVLATAIVLFSTAGFGVACHLVVPTVVDSSHHHDTDRLCPTDEERNDGGSPPASECSSAHGDLPPCCAEETFLLAYCPSFALLAAHDPLSAPPQVYLDWFVPPQNQV
ncbi:hypothetical protein A2G06_05845 [Geobacter anodireducens]|nr:hypothetical protein A2G06_05845 [Geobacter anodireducens]